MKKKELKIKYTFEENQPQLERALKFLSENFRQNLKRIKWSEKNLTRNSFPEAAVGIAPSASGKGSRSNGRRKRKTD